MPPLCGGLRADASTKLDSSSARHGLEMEDLRFVRVLVKVQSARAQVSRRANEPFGSQQIRNRPKLTADVRQLNRSETLALMWRQVYRNQIKTLASAPLAQDKILLSRVIGP